MELKQIEFFVRTADTGSINKAAKDLYTSQSNVSKVIGALENEMGFTLFRRNSRGVVLTHKGEQIYEYAKIVLKNAEIMKNIANKAGETKFSVSCYPSNMISNVLVEHYQHRTKNQVIYEFIEGTVEEITDNVANRISEIGILYFAEHQLNCFKHVMSHKHLEFHSLDKKEMCVYVGRNNPLFERTTIHFSELDTLSFVQPIKDFFSIEHHLETISIGAFVVQSFKNNKVQTNSDNLLINLLANTDMCSLGIFYIDPNFTAYDIKPLKIEGCSKCLVLGYVKRESQQLSGEAIEFLTRLKNSLARSL